MPALCLRRPSNQLSVVVGSSWSPGHSNEGNLTSHGVGDSNQVRRLGCFCFGGASIPDPSSIPLLLTQSLISIAGSDRLSATSRDREDRVRRIREQQEDERRKKLEELKEHVSQERVRKKGVMEVGPAKMNEEN